MDSFIFVLEIIGTIAFAVSGALVAVEKKMDIFGVAILGLTTATGGGVIRDVVLGFTPPATFRNPVYAVVAVVTSVVIFLPGVRRMLKTREAAFDKFLLLTDSVGLGVFTVVGVQAAWNAVTDSSAFLQIFVGVKTGVGGGILRDVFAGATPFIFVKHIYACASLVGAVVCVLLHRLGLQLPVSLLTGAAVVCVLRLLAAHYRWSLPKAV